VEEAVDVDRERASPPFVGDLAEIIHRSPICDVVDQHINTAQ